MTTQDKLQVLSKIYPKLKKSLTACSICPRNCRVNRQKGQIGYCGQDLSLKVYHAFLHFGEEPPISGAEGSGTIFFSGCNLKCVYCQNYKFSQLKKGKIINSLKLAQIMLKLKKEGAKNINLVTPSHFLPQILSALKLALERGLDLPLVYNTSGYEKKSIIKLLLPLVNCWLLDFKYFYPKTAKKYSNSPKYPKYIKEVCLYLGQHKNGQKRANLGSIPPIIIRHLLLPGHSTESKKILFWIKKNIPQAHVSIMSQYQPYFHANKYPKINQIIQTKEYNQIKKIVEDLELKGWLQEFKPQEELAGVYFKKK